MRLFLKFFTWKIQTKERKKFQRNGSQEETKNKPTNRFYIHLEFTEVPKEETGIVATNG